MKALKSEVVSWAGVHYAGDVFSTEGIVFRDTASTDVGIDGQLELISSDGVATGMLIGVQIKVEILLLIVIRKCSSLLSENRYQFP